MNARGVRAGMTGPGGVWEYADLHSHMATLGRRLNESGFDEVQALSHNSKRSILDRGS